MKRLILIWVGVIVLLIAGGAIYGVLTGMHEPEVIPETEISYYDDNGNLITEKIPDLPIDVVINGETYTYNPYVWAEKGLTINGEKFMPPYYSMSFQEAGYYPQKGSWFMKDEKHNLYIQRNTYYDYIFNISAYTDEYVQTASIIYEICEDLTLPGNIKLGISTKEEVEKLYGNSSETIPRDNKTVTEKYYATSDKKGERISLIYSTETNVLIAFEWTFDTRNVA